MSNVSAFSTALIVAALLGVPFGPLAPRDARAGAPAAAAAAKTEVAGEVVSVEGIVFVRADAKDSGGALRPARPGDLLRAGDIVNTASNGKVKILMKDKTIVDLGPSALFKLDHFAKNSGADREVDTSVLYGTMRAAVPQKIEGKGRFRVRTPTATMGVRGTEFVVRTEFNGMDQVRPGSTRPGGPNAADPAAARTEITVLQGKVEVTKPVVPGDAPAMTNRRPGSAGASAAPAPAPAPALQTVMLTAGMQVAARAGEAGLAKPATLDVKQLATLASVVKVTDNTFTRAVVIDTTPRDPKTNPGFGPNSPMTVVTGDATRAAIANTLAIPTAPPIKVNDIGVAGTFGAGQAFAPPAVAQPIGNRRLRVVVVGN